MLFHLICISSCEHLTCKQKFAIVLVIMAHYLHYVNVKHRIFEQKKKKKRPLIDPGRLNFRLICIELQGLLENILYFHFYSNLRNHQTIMCGQTVTHPLYDQSAQENFDAKHQIRR